MEAINVAGKTIYRKVEKVTAEGLIEVPFSSLQRGDSFRLSDPEGSEPRYEDGSKTYTAKGDAYPSPTPDGSPNFGIEIENE